MAKQAPKTAGSKAAEVETAEKPLDTSANETAQTDGATVDVGTAIAADDEFVTIDTALPPVRPTIFSELKAAQQSAIEAGDKTAEALLHNIEVRLSELAMCLPSSVDHLTDAAADFVGNLKRALQA